MTNGILQMLFWFCAACVIYTYVVYPLLIFFLAHFRGRPVCPVGRFSGSLSMVLAVFNEEASIDRRLDELKSLLVGSGLKGEILVVSDGSTDRTATLARRHDVELVRIVELPSNVGKAEALTRGCSVARGDVIVFADVRQRWAPDALENLLRNFTVPEVGAVSGDLIIETDSGVSSGVGLYWRFEKWLRNTESLIHSTVGVTGAISAVRRNLFRAIPQGTILDDLFWPLRVVMSGYRVVHERKALAFDHLPEKTTDEFRRKVRTLSGNFQLLARLPEAVQPWSNPIWFEFVSHKLMRLLVPWALLGALLSSALLSAPMYRAAFFGQLALYLLGLLGLLQGGRAQTRVTAAMGSFLVLNVAAWVAFWIWITGRASMSWKKAQYRRGIDIGKF